MTMNLTLNILPVTAFAQNCSLVMCNTTRKTAIIDPGGDVDKILAALQKMDALPEKILLTHGHIDHAGAAMALARALDIPIVGPHRADAFWLNGLAQQAQMFRFAQVENCTPDQWLNDGEQICIGNLYFTVIHTPGHTPGHVVFYSAEHKLAFVGDVLFHGSIGRTDFPQGNYEDLIASIRTKLFPLGEDVTFIPGHGEHSTFGEEMISNPFVADHRG
ncbi:MAG: hypothetical protein RL217_2122 [Pseudomonadota bacterium]|jgi:glyoxylase-like metal-dependent hydrolase (beta-lactamase superfamily II)